MFYFSRFAVLRHCFCTTSVYAKCSAKLLIFSHMVKYIPYFFLFSTIKRVTLHCFTSAIHDTEENIDTQLQEHSRGVADAFAENELLHRTQWGGKNKLS